MVYPALLPLMHTPRLPGVDWTDGPANLNGLVRFAERRNLVSAHVPSHFKRSLHSSLFLHLVAGPQLWESISFTPLSRFYPRSSTRDSFTSNCVGLMPVNSVWHLCGHIYGFISIKKFATSGYVVGVSSKRKFKPEHFKLASQRKVKPLRCPIYYYRKGLWGCRPEESGGTNAEVTQILGSRELVARLEGSRDQSVLYYTNKTKRHL